MGGDRRILALLTDHDDEGLLVREALVRADPGMIGVDEAERALEEVTAGGVELIVCDQRAADPLSVFDAIAGQFESGGLELPVFLALIADPALVSLDEDAFAHYLARPFRAETLTALCQALLDEAKPIASDDHDPAVSFRQPARFSSRPLYADAVAFARESLARAGEGLAPDMGWARLEAERVHTSLVQSNQLLNRALEPHQRFDLSTHSVNVAIFAGKIAHSRNRPLETTLRAIEAGLVHDVGMARLPQSLLYKDAGLTDDERAQMERHPALGAELIAQLGAGFAWLERVIRQEHERIGGQGYPEGLRGDEIDPLARIIGVADVFEAFSHARTYRTPFTAYEALERVVAMRGDHLDGSTVDALANEISVFPLDSYVQLSSGAIGRVIATNPDNLMRPTVELLWNESWSPIEPRIVALEDVPDVAIERPLHESEVPIT